MIWHCANKRRRRVEQPMECHWGDIPNEPLRPMRMPYRRRYEPPDWIAAMVQIVPAYVGIAVYALIVFIAVWQVFAALEIKR